MRRTNDYNSALEAVQSFARKNEPTHNERSAAAGLAWERITLGLLQLMYANSDSETGIVPCDARESFLQILYELNELTSFERGLCDGGRLSETLEALRRYALSDGDEPADGLGPVKRSDS